MTHEKNMKYLKSAQELYLEVCKKIKGNVDSIKAYEGYFEALDLLYQQPMLGDFVATNEDGEVMEKPEFNVDVRDYEVDTDKGNNEYLNEMNKQSNDHELYRQALSRVLWKGWKVESVLQGHTNVMKSEDIENGKAMWLSFTSDGIFGKLKTYEQLITSGVKLERIQKK